MEESKVLSKFDELVHSGIVRFDEGQKILIHEDGGLKFQFVLTAALLKKPTFGSQPQKRDLHRISHRSQEGSDINTENFEISDIGKDHFLAANMFCFARPHLMLLTSDPHARQYEALREVDFEAAWSLLNDFDRDYVVFYNCGQDGGCSRMHKHMQLMPLPTGTFAAFLEREDDKEPDVPFHWFWRRFPGQVMNTSASVFKTYEELLQKATDVGQGLSQHSSSLPPGSACPHNMVLTTKGMIVIPRRRAGINKEAGANAIGMLGYIAVATQNEINGWKQLGLKATLRELGVPVST
ncbi:ATP adenylyltransferase-domain-containing protein [Xylariomycetidae sp. FL2044]|nr:ATP adenylyltransferase-domain-containing protein [Xylariomycetidae sp. FL2044]